MAALTKDAVRIALFERRSFVSQRDIDRAFLQQCTGIENPIEEMAPEQRRQIAIHEAGHAVAQHYLLPDTRIAHLTIVARGSALGFMLPLDEVEIYAQPLRRIVCDIMVGMAGDMAVKVVLGEAWTGAYSDFSQVRGHLRHLYALGYFGPPVHDAAAEEAAKRGQVAIESFWRDFEGRVAHLLRLHKTEVLALADALLLHGDLSRNEVLAILGPNRPPAAAPAAPAGTPGSGEGAAQASGSAELGAAEPGAAEAAPPAPSANGSQDGRAAPEPVENPTGTATPG